jgi:putative restriction endonuclease
MNFQIYPTDHDWYRFLRNRPDLDEINFWQPGGSRVFPRLSVGELFLFRLKHPINRIAGGGFFLHSSVLPIDLAWLAFGEKNGVPSLFDLQRKIAKYKGYASPAALTPADQIGCIILSKPFFLKENEWLEVPADYARSLVQGKRYSALAGEGKLLYDAVLAKIAAQPTGQVREPLTSGAKLKVEGPIWSEGKLGRRRLGQGSFRVIVTDAYDRRCSVTGERTLPVLEAAHIKPVTQSGEHRVDNGLLLRSDIHTLFDAGYVTVTPNFLFQVSSRLRRDWSNGRVYYELDGREIRRPQSDDLSPSTEFLEWHADTLFLR